MSPRPTAAAAGAAPLALVVDDSAVVRQALTAILGQAGFRVVTAGDPLIALERMRAERPAVVVLDVEMPRMDGLSFLRILTADEHPIPVVICSSLAGPNTEVALQALEQGAVGVVTKPRLGVKGFLHDAAAYLVETVRAASHARVRRRPAPEGAPALPGPQPVAAPAHPAPPHGALARTTSRVVAVGASTGGTEALRDLLTAMPPDAPGLVVVQHMPEVFTAAFARRLDGLCRIEVKEAVSGDRICSGRALIAPGNHHLAVTRSGAHYVAEVRDGPPVSRHRPSVDVLFESAARSAGPSAVGVILTGMGDDGARGMRALRDAGAHTIAQDEATCVVYGMPREAVNAGGVCEVLPLPAIAGAVLRRAG